MPASAASRLRTRYERCPSRQRVRTTTTAGSSTPDATVDPTHPYTIQLDEGRSIAVFFYDGPNSRAIAFEGLLNSGEDFAGRLLSGFRPTTPEDTESAQIFHVATDGESYGHHHRHGEMALSYAMHWIEDEHHAKLTNYGEFLAKFPPQWEVEIVEDTSWSCAHGVERWRSDCGCNSGGKPGWNQQWRGPLREALDYLRDCSAPLAEKLSSSPPQRSLGRTRRLHPGHPRPLPRQRRCLLRRSRHPRAHRRRTHHRT